MDPPDTSTAGRIRHRHAIGTTSSSQAQASSSLEIPVGGGKRNANTLKSNSVTRSKRKATKTRHRVVVPATVIILGVVWLVTVAYWHGFQTLYTTTAQEGVLAHFPPRISRYENLEVCIGDVSRLPFMWLPAPGIDEDYVDEPWSPDETDLSELAVATAWIEWSEAEESAQALATPEVDGRMTTTTSDRRLYALMEWTDVLVGEAYHMAVKELRSEFLQASRRLLNRIEQVPMEESSSIRQQLRQCSKGQVRDPVPWMELANYGHLLVTDLVVTNKTDENEKTSDKIESAQQRKSMQPDPELIQVYESTVNAARDTILYCNQEGSLVDILLEGRGVTSSLPIALHSEVWDRFVALPLEEIIQYMEVAKVLLQANSIPLLSQALAGSQMDIYVAHVWVSLENYPLQYSTGNAQHFSDPKLLRQAQWASTQLATFVTGHFQFQRMADTPTWYPYLRDNFYFALETEDLGLIADFLEWIRSYGCTESNDYQLRQGTRYILNRFEDHDRTWAHWTETEEDGSLEHRRLLLAASKAVGVSATWEDPTLEGTYTRGLYDLLIGQGYYRQASIQKDAAVYQNAALEDADLSSPD